MVIESLMTKARESYWEIFEEANLLLSKRQ